MTPTQRLKEIAKIIEDLNDRPQGTVTEALFLSFDFPEAFMKIHKLATGKKSKYWKWRMNHDPRSKSFQRDGGIEKKGSEGELMSEAKIEWKNKLIKIYGPNKCKNLQGIEIQIPADVYGELAIHVSWNVIFMGQYYQSFAITHVPTGFAIKQEIICEGDQDFDRLKITVRKIYALCDWSFKDPNTLKCEKHKQVGTGVGRILVESGF